MTKIVNGIDGSHLQSYVERVEKLEADKKAISEDIKGIFSEAIALATSRKKKK